MSCPASLNEESVRRVIRSVLPPACANSEVLFGQGGSLDSLGLVNFIADLEYQLAESYGRDIVLASDRAMSRHRSPFRDVSALTEYILEELSR